MKFSPSFLIFLATTIDGFQLNVVPQRRSFNTGSDLCQIRAPWYELHRVQGRNHLPLKMATGGPAAADSSFLNHPLAELLTECKDFGLVRFISVNPSGSVLETAGVDMAFLPASCCLLKYDTGPLTEPLMPRQRVWILASRASRSLERASA